MRRHAIYLSLLGLLWPGIAAAVENTAGHAWDGSLAPPVHRFALFDENGQEVVPQSTRAMPFSTRNSCGSCHSYKTVCGGWHWSSSKGVSAGRKGEPWFLLDYKTGTQLPLSYRGWSGTWKPDQLGISPWQFTRLFGHHLPGGDMAEPADDDTDPNSRWDLSGKLEINCLACHSSSHTEDMSEWARQIARENFRWAATAASGIGDVDGIASRMPDSWRIADGPNPDDKEFAVAPSVRYDVTRFDKKHRTVLEVTRKPADKNCQQCHSVSRKDLAMCQTDEDVHTRAGMKCVDCHRNDLSHQIVRGYEGESRPPGDRASAELSCRGCHIDSAYRTGGRLSAPKPKHGGIPPVHFARMSCTACHSGPAPSGQLAHVRTSRANRLGIYGRADWSTDEPSVFEPVLMKGSDGKIAPFRVMWPAFWARMEAGVVTPLLPDKMAEAGKGILDGQDQISGLLTALAGDTEVEGTPVLIAKKKAISCRADGALKIEDYAGTMTVSSVTLAKKRADGYVPLLDEFDPNSALETSTEGRITKLLDLLNGASGKQRIALAVGKKLFELETSGSLKTTDAASAAEKAAWIRLTANRASAPLVSDSVIDEQIALGGSSQRLTENQVAQVLRNLTDQTSTSKNKTEYAYVSSGRMFRLGDGAKLSASRHVAAEPVAWPLGHDVRPARKSLGAKACTECHSDNSDFFFTSVKASGPLQTQAAAIRSMHQLEYVDPDYQRLFGQSFLLRTLLKTVLFTACGLIAIVLVPVSFTGARRISRYYGPKE